MTRTYPYRLSVILLTLLLCTGVFADTASSRSLSSRAVSAETLLAMDRQVIQAFLDGDAAAYSQYMSDDFFMFQGGIRASKDYAMGMVSAIKCEVSDSWGLSAPQVTRVNEQAYVLSYRMDIEGHCASGDVSMTLPSPVRAATLWVNDKDSWKISYHGENQMISAPVAEHAGTTGDSRSAESAPSSATDTAGETPESDAASNDPLTNALLAVESAVWETWRTHDASALTALTAKDIAFVNVFGDYFANKADTVANWTGPFCNISKFSLTQSIATKVLPSVAALTLTGSVDGTCGARVLDGMRVHVTTIYKKEAGAWKWAFGFNSP